jgi:hypothetical protein
MSRPTICFMLVILMATLLAACGPAAPALIGEEALRDVGPQTAPGQAESIKSEAVIYGLGSTDATSDQESRERLIVKDADINLLVADTDVALDRISQIVNDVGGYVISSRVWFEEEDESHYKLSTTTIGVPSDQFEASLSRIRQIAIRVLDESLSGEDATEEFVDLQAQLDNLNATRDRVRGFLEQAETVEEALAVNEELTDIEGQIEQIRGRMNYIADRAAFSTIRIATEPESEVPGSAEASNPTFQIAISALGTAYRTILDLLIWAFVVVIPVLAPFLLILWFIWRYFRRRFKAKAS